MFVLSSSSEFLYFACHCGSLLRLQILMQSLHRNFNQVERGFSAGMFLWTISSEQQGHSIVAIVFNAIDGNVYSVGVLSFKEIVSIQNSHDCPIEPSFKVRGHLSIIVPMSITSWPLWPSWEIGEDAEFLLSPQVLSQVKTQWLLMVWMVWIKRT